MRTQILIEKSEKLCENLGTAYIDLAIEKGKYKVYYMRIENEQRILSNSRLEVLGQSKIFSINQMNADPQSSDQQLYFEESFSNHLHPHKPSKFGSPNSESSIDSLVLMRQIQSNAINSCSYSVHSSDQTRMIGHGSPDSQQFSAYSNQRSEDSVKSSTKSAVSSQTFIVKKENDEAMILTKQSIQKAKHRRSTNNYNQVLDDISNQT